VPYLFRPVARADPHIGMGAWESQSDDSHCRTMTARQRVKCVTSYSELNHVLAARRQHLGNDSQHSGVNLRRTRLSLSSSAATDKVGVARSSRSNKIGAGPAPEGQRGALQQPSP